MRLLVIEDSALDYELLLATLALQGVATQARRVETAEALHGALAAQPWDLVISDHRLPGFTSADALAIVKAQAEPPPFIIVSGVIGEDAAVAALHRGAADFLTKGRLARLGSAARNAVAAARASREKARAEHALQRSQQQLRNLSNQLQALLEEQRVAIAREVHDEIGGTLTAVRLDLDGLRRHLDGPALQRLARAQDALGQAAASAQRVTRHLRPPILDAGLQPALESLLREFRTRTGLRVEFTACDAEPQLPEATALVVYRTCQEALTNIAKHARARSVAVDLHHGASGTSLEISDDGLGLPAEALHKPQSLGLRGLAERASAAGGALDISSSHGRTTLMLWLPAERTELEPLA